MATSTTASAFVLRIAPNGIDKVPESLANDELIIGWSAAEGLLDPALNWDQFRGIMQRAYHSSEPNLRKCGAAAGHMWRFIRDMKPGDLVVVPYGNMFYVAKVLGNATYDPKKAQDDSAYRRPVQWLNNKKPIPRKLARASLLSRMKIHGTSANADDLVDDIRQCIEVASCRETPTFQSDLQSRLVDIVLAEIRGGRIESYGFEKLIKRTLLGLGADQVRIVPRNEDKGADLIAEFRVAGAFRQVVAVQAKHWQQNPPVGRAVVEQLIQGIEAEGANLGMVVTSGSIDDDADRIANQYFADTGIRIELVDGEQLAKLIIEHGITL